MDARRYAYLGDAVTQAVRDILPVAGSLDAGALAVELEKRVSWYWGPDHGMGRAELLATAHDVKSTATRPPRREVRH